MAGQGEVSCQDRMDLAKPLGLQGLSVKGRRGRDQRIQRGGEGMLDKAETDEVSSLEISKNQGAVQVEKGTRPDS